MKPDSIREPPAPGTTGILSSDVSRTPSDAKKPGKSVNFKTAARVVQMGLSTPSDIVSDRNFDDPKKQLRNRKIHGTSTYSAKSDSTASQTGKLIPKLVTSEIRYEEDNIIWHYMGKQYAAYYILYYIIIYIKYIISNGRNRLHP